MLFLSFVFIFFVSLPFHYISFLSVHQFGKGGKGKIDLILTKSISRFARNTLDCIHYVRLLKSWGIPVIFEKECIDTSNMNSE